MLHQLCREIRRVRKCNLSLKEYSIFRDKGGKRNAFKKNQLAKEKTDSLCCEFVLKVFRAGAKIAISVLQYVSLSAR